MARTRPPFTQPRTNLAASMKRNAARKQCPECGRKNAIVRDRDSGEVFCKWNGHKLADGTIACHYYKPPKAWDA